MNSYCNLKQSHSARAELSKRIIENYKRDTFDDSDENVNDDSSIIGRKFEIFTSIPVKSRPCSTERRHNKSSDMVRDIPRQRSKGSSI